MSVLNPEQTVILTLVAALHPYFAEAAVSRSSGVSRKSRDFRESHQFRVKGVNMNIAIVGAGKLGVRIATALTGGDYSITVIDRQESVLNRIAPVLDVMTINEDARNTSVLKNIGIENFDYLISTTGDDETNIVITSFAKKLGCKHVICRIRDPEHMDQFDFIKEKMDIDDIINPDMVISKEIYKYLSNKYSLSTGIFDTGKVSLIEFPAVSLPEICEKQIPEVRQIYPDFLVVALSRNGNVMIPHGGDYVEKGDLVYMLGENNLIRPLIERVRKDRRQTGKFRSRVMIIGGGKTGFYLAKRLSEAGAGVKIIENSQERCHFLSQALERVMILHGDGTDRDLLEEENIEEMDAFISATGYDEDNLLLALSAKNKGVPDVIAKVSHSNYKDLIEKLGVNMVLNPMDIATSNISRYIEGSRKIVSYTLIQGQAELIEVIISEDMSVSGMAVKDLDIPDDLLLATVYKGSEIIIPDGNTRLEPGDRVTVLCLLSDIDSAEKFLRPRKG